MANRWYVVRAKPNCDGMAASALDRDGYESFSPRVSVPAEGGRRSRVPLFPGYIFLRCDIKGIDLPMVSRLPGVLGWVRFGGDVPPVPDGVISELRARLDTLHHSGGLWERFRVGQVVRVSQDALEALATVLEQPNSPDDRVRVLLEFMGRQVHAVVPWHSLSSMPEGARDGQLGRRGRRTRGRGRWIKEIGPRAAIQT